MSDNEYWADALAAFLQDYANDLLEYAGLALIAQELGMSVSEEQANQFAEAYLAAQRVLNDPVGEYFKRCQELGGMEHGYADQIGWAEDKAAEYDAQCAQICKSVAQRRETGMRLSIFDRAS